MGLFKKFKSKNNDGNNSDSICLSIFSAIADNDEHTVSDLKYCIENPKLFAKKNEELYDARGINYLTAPEYTIKWIGCVEILLRYNFAKEFDVSVDFDDFYADMGEIRIVKDKNILPPDDSIYLDYGIDKWLACIDHCWSKLGMCAGGIDINSDSYVVFVCTSEKLDELSKLAQKASKKICHASTL